MAKLRFVADRGAQLPSYFVWDDAISSFCKTEDYAFLADRFGYLNQFTRIDAAAISEGKLPAFDSTITFAACMESRAAEILDRCERTGRHCYVLWSGGCDSTAIIAALLSVGFPKHLLDVIYTQSSVEDYPEFFEFLKQDNIPLTLVPGYAIFDIAVSYAKQGSVVLTGFPADQLFGSILGQRVAYDTTKTHWTEYLKADKANQQYEAAFEHYGIPVKTVAEFLWFNNFALKWDYVCYPGLMMVNETHENIVSFYDTQEFQDWSVSNFDILHRHDQKDTAYYKIQMKDYIFAVTGLSSVYGLRKIPSILHAELLEPNPNGHCKGISSLDDEGTIITIPIISGKVEIVGAGFACASILRRYLKK